MNCKLSVITLNYKNVDLTTKCINSVIESTNNTEIDPELIVVDNSTEETFHQLKKVLPSSAKIIETKENLGFAKANNMGINYSTGDFVLLLNNDVIINKHSIETGITFLQENPDTAIWAPQLRGEDGEIQTSCARFPSLKGVIGEYLLGKQWDWYNNSTQWTEPQKVDTVIGAFMLMKKDILNKIGLLSEDYFFNMEDMEFCKRVRQNNYDIVYDPRSNVIHFGGASQTHNWVNDPYLHKTRISYFKKEYGWFASLFVALVIKIGLQLRKIKNEK